MLNLSLRKRPRIRNRLLFGVSDSPFMIHIVKPLLTPFSNRLTPSIKAEDLMMGSPSYLTKEQLEELGIIIKE